MRIHAFAMPILRSIAAALLVAQCLPAMASDSEPELSFIDLRLQGGLVANSNHGAELTLMCGEIGDKDQHVVDTYRDAGIVIGIRGLWDHVNAKISGGPDIQLNLMGVGICGGAGFVIDQEDHLEIVAGYGLGRAFDGTSSNLTKLGSYSQLTGEIGYYHTWAQHWQIGGLAGYSYDNIKLDAPDGGGAFPAKAQGFDLKLALGYRF
jgi:hypothetical protein